jgi:hypothetical protein
MMNRNRVSLRRRILLCQEMPADTEEKLAAFQRHVTGLRKMNNNSLSQVENADETLVYFNMPSNYTVDNIGAEIWDD